VDWDFLLNFSNELDSGGFYKDAEILDSFVREAVKKRRYKPNWKNIGIALSPLALGLLATKFHNQPTQPLSPKMESHFEMKSDHPSQPTPAKKHKTNYHLPKGDYQQFRHFIKEQEGGLTNRPLSHDPGGLTNKGITQKEYTIFLKNKKMPNKSVKYISDAEVNEIAKTKYWLASQAGHLPKSIALVIADWKFNGGWRPAYIQEILGLPITNKLDSNTIQAIWQAIDNDPSKEFEIVQKLISRRLKYLESLKTLNKKKQTVPLISFNPGWRNRLKDLEATSAENTQKSLSEMAKLNQDVAE